MLKFRRQYENCYKIVIAIFMATTIFFAGILDVVALADKISELEEKIEKIKVSQEKILDEIHLNKEVLGDLNSTHVDLKEALEILNKELTTVSENLELIENAVDEKNAQIESIKEDLEQAEQVKDKQYQSMKKRIKYMYEEKNYSKIEVFFSALKFSNFINAGDYFEAVSSYDKRMMERYNKTCEVIQNAKEVLDAEADELSALRNEALMQQNKVNELVNRTNEAIINYEDEIADTENKMLLQEKEYKEQQKDLIALQTKLEEEKQITKLANNSKWRDNSSVFYADGDRKLLANIIYCEAGNQSFEGQLAVGAVVMNRVKSEVFPDTIVGVIYQKNQFSPVNSGRLALALANDSATETCYRAADAAMAGQNNIGNCLFFRTPIAGLSGIRIEGHVFY